VKEPKVIIIGNSPDVFKNQYGAIIDSYDIVIRMNHCPTKGHEKYIGSKIDIWAATHQEKDNSHLGIPNNANAGFLPDGYQNIKQLWTRAPSVHIKAVQETEDFPCGITYVMHKTTEWNQNKEFNTLCRHLTCTLHRSINYLNKHVSL